LEVLYIPRFFWHATLNIGESMGSGHLEDPVAPEILHQMRAERPLAQPVHELNHLVGAGRRKDALRLVEKALLENQGELPLTALFAQLNAAFGDQQKARGAFQHLLKELNKALEERYIRPREAAFAFLRLAVSMANAGLNPGDAIKKSLASDKTWYSELVARTLVEALLKAGNTKETLSYLDKVANDPRWKSEEHGQFWVGIIKRVKGAGSRQSALDALAREVKEVPAGAGYVMSDFDNDPA
jgi:tetratricopeptide (TPR) repeat protein